MLLELLEDDLGSFSRLLELLRPTEGTFSTTVGKLLSLKVKSCLIPLLTTKTESLSIFSNSTSYFFPPLLKERKWLGIEDFPFRTRCAFFIFPWRVIPVKNISGARISETGGKMGFVVSDVKLKAFLLMMGLLGF